MAIDYVCLPHKRLAIVVWEGAVTLEAWRAHLDRMFADPEYARANTQISDLRYPVLDAAFTFENIKAMISGFASHRKEISGKRLALLASAEWERAKQAERLIELVGVHPIVFTNLFTACTWLDLDVVVVGNAIKELRLRLRANPAQAGGMLSDSASI